MDKYCHIGYRGNSVYLTSETTDLLFYRNSLFISIPLLLFAGALL